MNTHDITAGINGEENHLSASRIKRSIEAGILKTLPRLHQPNKYAKFDVRQGDVIH